ncbi:MAG: hypothetical protein ACOVQA_10180, partial [Thermoflexibacteraceae bacterium]
TREGLKNSLPTREGLKNSLPCGGGLGWGLLRAEIDAIVAKIYGLSEAELAYILSTFPIVPAEQKELVLAAFRQLG